MEHCEIQAKTSLLPVTKNWEVEPILFRENLPVLIENNELMRPYIPDDLIKDLSKVYFYKITELAYEKDFPHREAFENVVSSINNSSYNLVYFLSGNSTGANIYLGIVDNYRCPDHDETMNSYDVSQALINSLCGNFMGTRYTIMNTEEIKKEIVDIIGKSKRKSFIYGIPSTGEDKPAEVNVFQGIDRLINSMHGETYQLLLVCEPVDKKIIHTLLENVYSYYNYIAREAEKDYSANKTTGENEGTNESTSDSRSTTQGTGENSGHSNSSGGSSSSSSTSSGKSTNKGTSESHSTSDGKNYGTSTSESKTISLKLIEKKLKEQLEYIDEELLPRLKLGKSKGLFRTSIYTMSTNNAALEKLIGNVKSIFQGDKSTFAPLTDVRLTEPENSKEVIKIGTSGLISLFQIYQTKAISNPESYLLNGIQSDNTYCEMATFLTAREITLLGGLPMTEVAGISLNEAVDFGVNIPDVKEGFELGHIIHRGNILTKNVVKITKKVLNKHLFIGGVTGSGKTTTCQKILLESGLPFLVIEPAKTEYRQLYERNKSIRYYTVGRNDLCPLRINPLELIRGENLSSHIDMLMATFQAVYPMEASIPYILKEALINCYQKLGWDLESNENDYTENPWSENGLYWPVFSNLISELTVVVDSKGFAPDLKNNYIGSLVSRFNDLTLGTRGSIYNVSLSIDFEKIITQNAVIELDGLKNEEDKVLLMGLILFRLYEVLKRKHSVDKDFQHITLIEEAHRLLSKPDHGEYSKKHAIQTFTDMLAEARKYGESLIIVDQIPCKLTPEVIKNTNTKIIHKLFAEDDKTAIAHCIGLDDKQKKHLSKLNTGEVIIYTEGWHKPVCVKINAESAINPSEIDESAIAAQGKKLMNEEKLLFFPAFSEFKLNDRQIDFLSRKKNGIVRGLLPLIKFKLSDEESEKLKQIIKPFEKDFHIDKALFNALSTEIWVILKCFYYDYDIKQFRSDAIRWLSHYFEMAVNDHLVYNETNDEFVFISKIHEKINKHS